MSKTIKLSELENGRTFTVGEVEYIKVTEKEGVAAVVTKGILFCSEFGKDNDFSKSIVLERLEKEFLPKVAEAIGEENICEFETDLTTLDGLKPYEVMKSKVSIPTFDFYREHVEIFDKYKVDEWWWLATPETAQPHYEPIWISCVSPRGCMNCDYYDYYIGVRSILNFVSSILVSCEEE